MDLKNLKTFLVLCEIQNFTKTAKYLHYAQSNVTAQIKQLEKELNVQLFERLGKKVTLTSSGKELIPLAKKMLQLSEEIQIKFSNEKCKHITIGASESMCIYKLPAIIKAFQIEHPSVELYLQVLDTPDFIPLLIDNTIDIAITLDTPINNSNIKVVSEKDEKIGLFTTPNHILSKKVKVSINDLAKQPLILTGKECCYRKMFEKDLAKASLTPKIALETSSLQIIKQATLSGLGICILPQLAVLKELENKELIKINYDTNYKIVSQVIYHKDKWLSQNLNDFIDIAKQMIK